ncbi:entericidin A/B family lipoprotein [Luteolibacter sp. SL250]|uniref:entericidin A/B family lipoprotein n=1 Tax=Luteolibacter sp. SL250 TaxID=2995170 RepID=UPI00226E74E0|nr:entericidin A/B family lipoprotein [Luteolibacter sp. SL250]WAC19353.1 entericidin A/B family lipoprotein [Luteolibacter sp. SL250]
MNPVVISKTAANHFNRILLCGSALMVTAALALSTTSCATSKGFGRDVKKVGNKIENAADRTGGAN